MHGRLSPRQSGWMFSHRFMTMSMQGSQINNDNITLMGMLDYMNNDTALPTGKYHETETILSPIYQNLNGPQLKTNWRATLGYQYAF